MSHSTFNLQNFIVNILNQEHYKKSLYEEVKAYESGLTKSTTFNLCWLVVPIGNQTTGIYYKVISYL